MPQVPSIRLNSGYDIPQIGLGVYQLPPPVTKRVVLEAFEVGYRHIDTAALYGNEREVGQAVAASGLPREEIYVTTKLPNPDHAYDVAIRTFHDSLSRLGLDYVDLFLIHWPLPSNGLMVQAWEALIEIRERGLARSIGVSNFRPEDLAAIIDATGQVPAANQVELNPHFQQGDLRGVDKELGIVTEAWSPLGQGRDLTDPVLVDLAAQVGRTPAQVVIRWMVQLGIVVFPKTSRRERLVENISVFDFELTPEQMQVMESVDTGRRHGPDPAVWV
jgi:2,5-diketo-D-gluconate reductase A